MSSKPQRRLISEADYLDRELDSPIKHEYLGGNIYAMNGERNLHNKIATNILGAVGRHLDGKPCQPFNSDTKVRAKWKSQTRFYYPDVSIICQENPEDDSFQNNPAVIVEVLSKKTRRIDEGEKKSVYLTIPSLDVCLLVEQDQPLVVVHRRKGQEFAEEVFAGLDMVIPLPEVGIDLSMAEIYKLVNFSPEPPDSEE